MSLAPAKEHKGFFSETPRVALAVNDNCSNDNFLSLFSFFFPAYRTPSPTRARSPSPRRRMFRSRSRSPEKGMEETVDSGERSLSPTSKMSPSKSLEMSGEIDPETVRSALRDFAQSMKEAERERDEAMAKVNNLQRAMDEIAEDKAETEQRLQALQKSLGEAEEGIMRDVENNV